MTKIQARALVHLMRGSEPVGVDGNGDQVDAVLSPLVHAFLIGVESPLHGAYEGSDEPWAEFFEGVAAALRGQS